MGSCRRYACPAAPHAGTPQWKRLCRRRNCRVRSADPMKTSSEPVAAAVAAGSSRRCCCLPINDINYPTLLADCEQSDCDYCTNSACIVQGCSSANNARTHTAVPVEVRVMPHRVSGVVTGQARMWARLSRQVGQSGGGQGQGRAGRSRRCPAPIIWRSPGHWQCDPPTPRADGVALFAELSVPSSHGDGLKTGVRRTGCGALRLGWVWTGPSTNRTLSSDASSTYDVMMTVFIL